jgi:hypothetical protein
MDNADDIKDEDLAKKTLLLYLLLGGINFEATMAPVIRKMLEDYSLEALRQAEKEIRQIGEFTITDEQRQKIIQDIVAGRMAFVLPEIERATREMVAGSIDKVKDVDGLKTAITGAYALSTDRADNIADIEHRYNTNQIRIAAAKQSGIVPAVLVSDGLEFDGPCIEANGQVWSLAYAEDHVLQHPNCRRFFTFLSQAEVDELGGIDIE